MSEIGKRINSPVSHEWIYQHVAADKAAGGQLYWCLRQGHKRYEGKNTKRSPIPNAVYIDYRPEIMNTRGRLGDWEADTVLGTQGTGVLVTLAERKSRQYLVQRIEVSGLTSCSKLLSICWSLIKITSIPSLLITAVSLQNMEK